MTNPTQQNCEHQPNGWCLKCVGELASECDAKTEEIKRLWAHIDAMWASTSKMVDLAQDMNAKAWPW